MSELGLHFSCGSTRIIVAPHALDHIGKWLTDEHTPPIVFVCADSAVFALYGKAVMASLAAYGLETHAHTFPPGDTSKTLATLDAIYDALGRVRLGRDGLLLALGGGVATDLTGFAAATWMRGVRYASCPTTLEADIDAAIGGKTGINHAAGKNMVGAFHHPDLVAIDPLCLNTLPARDLAAGLAESIKHALIRDAELVAWHERNRDAIRSVDPPTMAQLIERNLRIKAAVVEADEKEHGQRAILNFGHTIGHAVEKWFQYDLRHGEAVSLGMVAAARISQTLGLLDAATVDRISVLLASFDLPVRPPRLLDVDAIMALTQGDKKAHAGRRRWVLLNGIGRTLIRDDVPDEVIRDAVLSLTEG